MGHCQHAYTVIIREQGNVLLDGKRHNSDELQTVCTACGKVLFARYDLDSLGSAVKPADFAARRWDMWRYAELLPIRSSSNVVSLGEGLTPLVGLRREARAALGLEQGDLLLDGKRHDLHINVRDRGDIG